MSVGGVIVGVIHSADDTSSGNLYMSDSSYSNFALVLEDVVVRI